MPLYDIWYCGHCPAGPFLLVNNDHCAQCGRRRDFLASYDHNGFNSAQELQYQNRLSRSPRKIIPQRSPAEFNPIREGETDLDAEDDEENNERPEADYPTTNTQTAPSEEENPDDDTGQEHKEVCQPFRLHNDDASDIEKISGPSKIESLFSPEGPRNEDLYVLPARQLLPGESSFASTSTDRRLSPVSRSRRAETRRRGTCKECKKKKKRVSHA